MVLKTNKSISRMRAAGAKNLNTIPFLILWNAISKGRTHISGSEISKFSPAAPISDRPPASQIWSKQRGLASAYN